MGSLNSVTLIGNLGQDPDIKMTQSNQQVVNLSVATSRSWKDKATGEWQENTTWHRVVCWGYAADKAAKFRRGKQVCVTGEIQSRKYTGQDGIERTMFEIKAENVFMTGRKGEGKPAGVGDSGHFEPPQMEPGPGYDSGQPDNYRHPAASPSAKPAPAEMEDDLPF